MTDMKFYKTGNFWIDIGIVQLHKVMLSSFPEVTSILEADKLIISVQNDKVKLIDILNNALRRVEAVYVSPTKNFGWYYTDECFKKYQKKDFRLHLKSFFKGKVPSAEGTVYLSGKKNAKPKDLVLSEIETEKFKRFKEENRENKLDDKGFLNHPPQLRIGKDILEGDFVQDKKKHCEFSFEKLKETRDVNGIDFPFLTSKGRGEINFASMLKTKPKISNKYGILPLFSLNALHYLSGEGGFHYFVLYDSDLKSLSTFNNTIQSSIEQVGNDTWSSFVQQIKGTQHEHECLLNFLISIYQQVRKSLKREQRKSIYEKAVYTFSNNGAFFSEVREFNGLSKLFMLFDSFETADEFNAFLNFIRFFQEQLQSGGSIKYNTIWRNKLAERVLNFQSIAVVVEHFFSNVLLKNDKAKSVYFLDKIFELYNHQILHNMNNEMVDLCKKIGNRIGAYCRTNGNMGILYSIRNSKNRTDFLKVLAETQFKTQMGYSEDFFKSLPDDRSWEEYKALVSVFAMNSYLYKPDKK